MWEQSKSTKRRFNDGQFDIQAYYTEEDRWQVEKITFTNKTPNQKLLKQQIINTFLEDIN